MYFKNLLFQIVEASIEYQNRDNLLFICGLTIALLMFIIQTWGLLAQNIKIARQGSEALSLIFFTGQFIYFFGYINYGLYSHNLTIAVSSLSGLIFIPIIFNIARDKIEQAISCQPEKKYLPPRLKFDLIVSSILLVILIPAIYLVPDKNLLLMILLITVIASLYPQIYQIIKYKTVKNIAIKYLWALIISSLLYLIYGIMISVYIQKSWGIIVTSSTSLIGLLVFYFLKMKKSLLIKKSVY